MNKKQKSVITCDMEGRIETYNQGAEEIFGYQAEEVIGKKRVSFFSPGQTVLEFVPNWLKVASEQGEYRTKTVFLDRARNPVAAEIRITPTFKDGQQIGYCGVTEVLEDVKPEEVAPNISFLTRIFSWFVITRARHNHPNLDRRILGCLHRLGAALSMGFVLNSSFCRNFPAYRGEHVQ